MNVGIYPLPFKMHVSEWLSNFNSRRCDEIMVVQENILRIIAPAFSNQFHPCSVIMSYSNDEVMLLKRFFDGFKMTLYRVK